MKDALLCLLRALFSTLWGVAACVALQHVFNMTFQAAALVVLLYAVQVNFQVSEWRRSRGR